MSRGNKTLLVFGIIFAAFAIAFFVFTIFYAVFSYTAFFSEDPNLGTAFFGSLSFIFSVIFGIGSISSSLFSLPFSIILLVKNKNKDWYPLTLVIIAGVIIVLSIVLIAGIPIMANARNATNSSSSISSSSSMSI